MDSKDLEIFRAVYETGGFAKAGQRLHTVQSNVSARIKFLETSLNVLLFRRTRRHVQATEAGDLLYDYAGRILSLEREMRQRLIRPETVAGTLRLGAMETTTAVRLPDYFRDLRQAHPEIAVDMQTGPTLDLIQAVCRHQLDAALIGGTADHPMLAHHKVFDEELALFASDADALADLASQPILVFRAGCAYRRHLEVFLANQNVFPARIMEMGTLDGILGCVAAGLGITMLPRSAVEQHRLRAGLVERALPEATARISTNLIYHRRDEGENPALQAFLSVLPTP